MSEILLVEKKPPITWLKLNRPEALNSLSRTLLQALLKACDELKRDKDTRIVIITGAGTKAFCAGADLAERKGMTEGETLAYITLIQNTMSAIESLPQPVIAAINGSAYGGGTELACACDLRIMVEEASLRLTEVKLGIIPGAGGTQRLSRLIGKSKAKEMILTAKPMNAKEGLSFGLIHRVVKEDDLINEASAWAEEIATGAPLSLKQAKWAIDNGFDRDLAAGLAMETKAYLQLVNTKDRQEGLAAFAEKRPPVYRGE